MSVVSPRLFPLRAFDDRFKLARVRAQLLISDANTGWLIEHEFALLEQQVRM